MPMAVERLCLVVIDGWGMSSEDPTEFGGDAIRQASTPVMNGLVKEFGCLPLAAHGEAVGLPAGLMGNSEVGHLNIGAGRVVYQDILRIQNLLEDPFESQPFNDVVNQVKQRGSKLHLIGLVSDGGVHSHIDHLLKLVNHFKTAGLTDIYVHAITDGRDTAPKCCLPYFDQLGSIKVATVMGRYYAMDRDKRWERTKIAFDAMTKGHGEKLSGSLSNLIKLRYEQGETDEFLKPIIVDERGMIGDNDVLVFFNFRSDRMRQFVQAFGLGELPFTDSERPTDIFITTMTKYREDFTFPLLSPPQTMTNVLAEWLSKQDLAQVHVAETEKFSHVTVFFNGGREVPFKGEERILIPSPKVATYDLKPEMSSAGVADAVIKSIKERHPFVMCNFAPPDMVGHTGHLTPAIQAVEATDFVIGRVYEACKANGYTLVVTADHGNAERMVDVATGQPHKAHTCAKVPLIITRKGIQWKHINGRDAALCDVAPTCLALMNVSIPSDMTGASVL